MNHKDMINTALDEFSFVLEKTDSAAEEANLAIREFAHLVDLSKKELNELEELSADISYWRRHAKDLLRSVDKAAKKISKSL